MDYAYKYSEWTILHVLYANLSYNRTIEENVLLRHISGSHLIGNARHTYIPIFLTIQGAWKDMNF